VRTIEYPGPPPAPVAVAAETAAPAAEAATAAEPAAPTDKTDVAMQDTDTANGESGEGSAKRQKLNDSTALPVSSPSSSASPSAPPNPPAVSQSCHVTENRSIVSIDWHVSTKPWRAWDTAIGCVRVLTAFCFVISVSAA
jgi:hypothetical protein